MKAISIKLKIAFFVIFAVVICTGFFLYKLLHGGTVNNQPNDDGHLIFAHTICRHGDRTPFLIYPTDPWTEESWPEGLYQLTEVGKQEHYLLGQYLRKRYSELVGSNENAAERIYVQSTERPRVYMSAEANLAGFFSLHNQSNDRYFNSTMIPIHTVKFEGDYVLATEKRCDRFDYLMIEYEKTTAYTELFEDHKSLIAFLEEKSGLKLRTITDITNLYDTLFIERLKGFKLPEWAENVMKPHSDFEYLAFKWYDIFTPTSEMKKLRSGYLLKEILTHFTNKLETNLLLNHTLWMYIAHDSTIANMLDSLGVFKLHIPPYASCIFFELYQANEAPFVQVFYRNTTQTSVPPLEIPNCGTKCPLNKFYELYDDILPKNSFDEECALREGEHLPIEGNPENNAL